MTKKQTKLQEEQGRAFLREIIKPGDTVYTSLQHVSSDGMSRRIRLFVIDKRNDYIGIRNITRSVAFTLGSRYNEKHESLVVGGVGMDMGYHVVYSLSRRLFLDNFTCIGKGCPSNDHVNGDPKGYEIGHMHSDSGYALKHSWL